VTTQGQFERPPLSAASAPGCVDGAATRRLLSLIKEGWLQGAAPDARAALSQNPELEASRSIVLDLAYEEYCRRQETGDTLDPDKFCQRFPAHRNSLRRLLEAHRCLHARGSRPSDERPLRWPEPGDSFLGFTLLRELGRGAFARVFLATEPALGDRPVAVKVSLEGAAEAEILGQLAHPNIVPVHSVQKEELTGWTVVCMPFLGSATLCDVLDVAFARPEMPRRARLILEAIRQSSVPGDPVPALEPAPSLPRDRSYVAGILWIALQLADALRFVHARQIFHCDLKPSNVLLATDGRPMLLDFNLSVDRQNETERLGGTVPYMAPEQLRATDPQGRDGSARVDARSDLFSLGVILYELLTGTHPFGPISLNCSLHGARTRLLEAQRKGPRPLREINRRVPRAAACVIEQCLAYDPANRPMSAAELSAAMRRSLPWPERLRSWTARRLHAVLVVGLGVALAVVAGLPYVLSTVRAHRYQHAYANGLAASQRGDYQAAVNYFTRVLEAEPERADIYFARGRAYQRLNDFPMARADFKEADRRAADGRTKAAFGYCLSCMAYHDIAAVYYEEAIAAGYARAEVWNNLGYSYLQRSELQKAKAALDRAILLDPACQVFFYNRALVDLEMVGHDPEHSPVAGLADIEEALRLGPGRADLYYNAACLGAEVAQQDPRQLENALSYAQKALQRGFDPVRLAGDARLSGLRRHPRFNTVLSSTPASHLLVEPVHFLDPIRDLAE
jgi:eukaryotic-like serine/threonine-protein kinase